MATDMPGVLASGSVASNANHSNLWGAKKATSSSYVTKGNGTGQNTGIFNVPHNVGSTNYTVMVVPTQDNISVRVINKASTSIQVSVKTHQTHLLTVRSITRLLGITKKSGKSTA